MDIDGRLIGINTAILSRSGGSQGVGFAVPSDLARNVMHSLIAYGHVTRGYLGVSIQNVTPVLAEEFKLKAAEGALVSDVLPDSPAAKAGFKDGDVVLEFNGQKVTDSLHLRLAVADTQTGFNGAGRNPAQWRKANLEGHGPAASGHGAVGGE